jgi:hypothetical protein
MLATPSIHLVMRANAQNGGPHGAKQKIFADPHEIDILHAQQWLAGERYEKAVHLVSRRRRDRVAARGGKGVVTPTSNAL